MARRNKNEEWKYEFSRRIVARMDYLKIDVTRLAKISGLSVQNIWNYIHCRCVPGADKAAKLAFGLAMTTDELIGFDV